MRKTNILVFIAIVVAVVEPRAAQHMTADKAAPETEATKLHDELGLGRKILVIDVRTPKEFQADHIPGSVNIPLDELERKVSEMKLAKDTTIVTICEHGGRSSNAAMVLQKMGYKTVSYCRLDHWRAKDYKVEKGDAKPKKTAWLPGRDRSQMA
ncbi:MAG: rhodanese-like domain-containing protein [Deltaproteobacteria bacterium]